MKKLLEKLFDIVPEQQTKRFNCPKCNGLNSFSVTKLGSKIIYQCFKASCILKGSKTSIPSLDSLKTRLNGVFKLEKGFIVPDYWIKGIASKTCLSMIQKTNSIIPYKNGYFEVMYDPKQDRLVYLIKKDSKIVGAVGRSLHNQYPKVLTYLGSETYPFICGKAINLAVVEDCASACAVSNIPILTGMALLGTNLPDEFIPIIQKYKNIYIALDPDARKKAIALVAKLKYYHPNVKLWMITKDIKNMNMSELQENVRNLP